MSIQFDYRQNNQKLKRDNKLTNMMLCLIFFN